MTLKDREGEAPAEPQATERGSPEVAARLELRPPKAAVLLALQGFASP